MAPNEILDFWFGAPDSAERGGAHAVWFTKSAATDAEIRARFGTAIEAALAGRLDAWSATPDGALALILLLDQFTRNVYRDTARAFAGDARALDLARTLVASGSDAGLSAHERWFVYMPFEHSEDLADQHECVRLFERLAADGLADPLSWAIKHREVIERFGRFPHRNEILGRASTPEEMAFLQQPGSQF